MLSIIEVAVTYLGSVAPCTFYNGHFFKKFIRSSRRHNNIEERLCRTRWTDLLLSRTCLIGQLLLENKQIHMYTGCPRRNVPDSGRVFLMLNYTDITQNTNVQS